MLQYAQCALPVSGEITVPPNGAHRQRSRLRWSDFSCLAQSYLLLNKSQQNVHGNILLSWFLSFIFVVFTRVRFVTLLRERLLELRKVAELVEALEAEE